MEFFTTDTLFAALLLLAQETNTYFSFMVDGGGSVVWVGTWWVRETTAEKALAWGYKKMYRVAQSKGVDMAQLDVTRKEIQ